jgi:hypothetical protein
VHRCRTVLCAHWSRLFASVGSTPEVSVLSRGIVGLFCVCILFLFLFLFLHATTVLKAGVSSLTLFRPLIRLPSFSHGLERVSVNILGKVDAALD